MAKANKKQEPREEVSRGATPGTPEWDAIVTDALGAMTGSHRLRWDWADLSLRAIGPIGEQGPGRPKTDKFLEGLSDEMPEKMKFDRLFEDIITRSNGRSELSDMPPKTTLLKYRAGAQAVPPGASEYREKMSPQGAGYLLRLSPAERLPFLDKMIADGLTLSIKNIISAMAERQTPAGPSTLEGYHKDASLDSVDTVEAAGGPGKGWTEEQARAIAEFANIARDPDDPVPTTNVVSIASARSARSADDLDESDDSDDVPEDEDEPEPEPTPKKSKRKKKPGPLDQVTHKRTPNKREAKRAAHVRWISEGLFEVVKPMAQVSADIEYNADKIAYITGEEAEQLDNRIGEITKAVKAIRKFRKNITIKEDDNG